MLAGSGVDVVDDLAVARTDEHWTGRFQAMAGPCEMLFDLDDASQARRLATLACDEARRIECKFSRYRDDSIITKINRANGTTIDVDAETAALLDYADTCFRLSEGRFDVTSGVLRRAWRFDGSDRLPQSEAVAALLPHIGWQHVTWQRPHLTLPAGMEIDFGGIGKEYAVDRVLALLSGECDAALLVNFGGDLTARGPCRNGRGWLVAIENPQQVTNPRASAIQFELERGAVATSGDTRRFLLKDGVRYGHILDPRTGWPVPDAPRSVTVVAGTCLEAGMLATFAMLHGEQAESLLDAQGLRYWCLR